MADRGTEYRWDDMPREELNPLIGRRFVTGEHVMLAQIYLAKGSIVPKHSHENEQITWVLEGRMRLKLGESGEQVVDLGPGDVLHIPPNVPHEAEAFEDTLDIDVFSPPRADWIDGSDSYLRAQAPESASAESDTRQDP
jgi:quercetin dioxygenase-like cupin family protein